MAQPEDSLHITICQRLVGAHRNMRRISVQATRDEIRSLTRTGGERDARLREKLERATGLSIEDLQQLSERWGIPAKD